MGRSYSSAQQSIDYLKKVMKSLVYAASAKISKQKVIDHGLENNPPCRLMLSELATTLDIDTPRDQLSQYGGPARLFNTLTRGQCQHRTTQIPANLKEKMAGVD